MGLKPNHETRLISGLSKRDETKFLLVEDDAELAQWLIRALKQRHDFTIERVDDGLLADHAYGMGNSTLSSLTLGFGRWTDVPAPFGEEASAPNIKPRCSIF